MSKVKPDPQSGRRHGSQWFGQFIRVGWHRRAEFFRRGRSRNVHDLEQIFWTNSQRGAKHVQLNGTLSTSNDGAKSDLAVQTITIPAGSLDMPGVSGLDKQTIGADVLLNNDDDNSDGTPDNHNGYTLGEDDLVPLTLHASGAGGRYQLEFTDSGDSQAIKVWAKSDKSASDTATHIVGGTGVYRIGSDQTILDASVDKTLYVEGFNFGVDRITLRWKSDTSNSPYNPADYIKVWVYGVKLMYQSQDVTSAKAADVLVGQFEQVSTQIFGPADLISNPTYSWSVDGNAYKDYTLDRSSANPALTPLAGGDLNQSSIGYFWTDGGNKDAKCSVTMAGHTISRSTQFASETPTVAITRDTQGTVGIAYSGANRYMGLINANPGGDPDGDGMAWKAHVQVPSGFADGQWAIAQVVDYTYRYRINGNAVLQSGSFNGQSGLDTAFPYTNGGPFTASVNPPVSDPLIADHPSFLEALNPANETGSTFYQANEQFKTWIMFMPAGENSKWVPLKLETWGWKAQFNRNANPPPNTDPWSLDSSSVAQWASGMQNTSTFPVWSQIFNTANFQWA